MNNKILQLGFVPPVIQKDHYVFGAEMVPRVVLQPNGQWINYLPCGEKQSNDFFDTYGCTVFGTLNALEILHLRIEGNEENESDRFTYIMSDTFPPGNDPHIVAEAIRDNGVIREERLPFSQDITTLEKFRDMGIFGASLMVEGMAWREKYDFLHEWVFKDNMPLVQKQNALIECLTFSPQGISVVAWKQRENGLYYKEMGEGDTHWPVLIGYEVGKYWIVFDTYANDGQFIKHLEWNYDFGFAKRYYLQAKAPQIPTESVIIKESIFTLIIKWLINLIKKI